MGCSSSNEMRGAEQEAKNKIKKEIERDEGLNVVKLEKEKKKKTLNREHTHIRQKPPTPPVPSFGRLLWKNADG